MKEYAVYKEGTYDNDDMDWFENWKAAFTAAEEMAAELEDGESLYLSKVEDGDFESFPLEFRKEVGMVLQYMNGERLFL